LILDRLTRAFFEMSFELRYLKARADEFQDFFASIMEKRYPSDFMKVRPWGNVGDRKNDGYLRSRRQLFQSYAPNEMKAVECIAKIDEDFAGALPHWKEYFDQWVFVHNSKEGLGPDVTAKLLALTRDHAPLQAVAWGFEDLRQEAFGLTEADLASLLGPAPTQTAILNLGVADLQPVLDQIAKLPPSTDPDLRPVSPEKLKHNMLSDQVETLLTAGMSRSDVVRRYFRAATDQAVQDKVAAMFLQQYDKLRRENRAPDEIFAELQRFTGGAAVGPPSRQAAVLAVLAYFFQECDIFERPPEKTP
jgi:antitoxin component HigA of HigAB toxin-antitoxin module